jgi:hypothetical protein
VTAAGFVDFAIDSRTDVFAGAEQSSSAANFGTLGITFRASKAATDGEWQQALEALSCDMGAGGETLNAHAQRTRLQEG